MESPATPPNASLRDEIRSGLETTRVAFHDLLGSVEAEDWGKRSGNPAWTVGEVLYHLALRLQLLARSIGWVPKLPASVFNRLTVPMIRIGARKQTQQSVAEKYDDAHYAALRLLDSIQEGEWDKGVSYPNWDSLLEGYVTIERLFRHPAAHFELHSEEIRQGLQNVAA